MRSQSRLCGIRLCGEKAKAINDANAITMGAMIIGEAMACEMVDAWLDTKFAEGFEQLREFLESARGQVGKIDAANRADS